MPFPLSFMPQTGGGQPTDPTEQLLQDIAESFERSKPTKPTELKTWQKVVGSIGDAIMAMATVRAGGAPPQIGAFRAQQLGRQQDFEQRTAEHEVERGKTERMIKVGAAEARSRREHEESMVRIKTEGIEEQKSIANELRARALEIQAQNAANAEERTRFQGEANDIRRSLGEQALTIREQGLKIQEQNLALRTTNRPLPASITSDIGEIDASLEAAQSALSNYKALGRPDLGFVFSRLTPERFANPNKITARRQISEALVPIRKYFLGTAVSAAEQASAAPLIANLAEGAPPNVIEESLIGLVNIAERGRRARIRAAEMAGFNVSGFPTTEQQSGQPTATTPGGKPIKYRLNERGQIVVEE